jgi:division protein 1
VDVVKLSSKMWMLLNSVSMLLKLLIMFLAFSILILLTYLYQVSGSGDNTVRLWDLNTEQCLLTLRHNHNTDVPESSPFDSIRDHRKGLASITSIHDNPLLKGVGALQFYHHALATGGSDGIIRLWDTRQQHAQTSIRSFAGHTLPITCLQFDEFYLMSGSVDRSLRVWDLRTGSVVEGFMSQSSHGIVDFQFDQDKIVAAIGEENVTVS